MAQKWFAPINLKATKDEMDNERRRRPKRIKRISCGHT